MSVLESNAKPHVFRRVGLETTAANAQIEAPTASIARKVEENAEHVHDAACDAADKAKVSFNFTLQVMGLIQVLCSLKDSP